jgi:hypothetical protein
MLMWKMVCVSTAHPGTYCTGMGIDLDDGVGSYRVRALDNFDGRRAVGLLASGNEGVFTSYSLPSTDTDWSEEKAYTLLGSNTLNFCRLYIEDEDTPAVDVGYASTVASTLRELRVGFVDQSLVSFIGSMGVASLTLYPYVEMYEALDAAYPDASGWLRSSDAVTRSITSGCLEVDATTLSGAYDVYYKEITNYDGTSGLTVLARFKILAWVGETGEYTPYDSEFGPVVLLSTGTKAVQLFFVKTNTGKFYAFLPGTATDYKNVIAQDSAGKRISCAVDPTEDHTYRIEARYLQPVRLYLDNADTPAIEVPWAEAELVWRAKPTVVPGSATLAFGSLGETRGVQVSTLWVRAAIGMGYDFTLGLALPAAALENHVYGSAASLVLDLKDMD